MAILECEVEAFPEPTTWWERDDGKPLDISPKHRMEIYDKRDLYKVIFQSTDILMINI